MPLEVDFSIAFKLTGCEKEIIRFDAIGILVAELVVAEATPGTAEAVLTVAETSAGSDVSRLWIDAEAPFMLLEIDCSAAVKLTVCEKEIIRSDAASTVTVELLVAEAVLGTAEAALIEAEISDCNEASRQSIGRDAEVLWVLGAAVFRFAASEATSEDGAEFASSTEVADSPLVNTNALARPSTLELDAIAVFEAKPLAFVTAEPETPDSKRSWAERGGVKAVVEREEPLSQEALAEDVIVSGSGVAGTTGAVSGAAVTPASESAPAA
jgi:hypothetical protein